MSTNESRKRATNEIEKKRVATAAAVASYNENLFLRKGIQRKVRDSSCRGFLAYHPFPLPVSCAALWI